MDSMVLVIQSLLASSGYFNGFRILNELKTKNISSLQLEYSLKTTTVEWFLKVEQETVSGISGNLCLCGFIYQICALSSPLCQD